MARALESSSPPESRGEVSRTAEHSTVFVHPEKPQGGVSRSPQPLYQEEDSSCLFIVGLRTQEMC